MYTIFFFYVTLYFTNLFKTNLVVLEYNPVPETLEEIIELNWKAGLSNSDWAINFIVTSKSDIHMKIVELAWKYGLYQDRLDIMSYRSSRIRYDAESLREDDVQNNVLEDYAWSCYQRCDVTDEDVNEPKPYTFHDIENIIYYFMCSSTLILISVIYIFLKSESNYWFKW